MLYMYDVINVHRRASAARLTPHPTPWEAACDCLTAAVLDTANQIDLFPGGPFSSRVSDTNPLVVHVPIPFRSEGVGRLAYNTEQRALSPQAMDRCWLSC